jgi:hypothetical protein
MSFIERSPRESLESGTNPKLPGCALIWREHSSFIIAAQLVLYGLQKLGCGGVWDVVDGRGRATFDG